MEDKLRKKNETFILKIYDRQHSTWQGSITWVEQDTTQNFRSALELMKLIDGALDQDFDGRYDERR